MLVVFSYHRAIETIKETLTTGRNMVHDGKKHKTTVQEGFRRLHDDKIGCQTFACFNPEDGTEYEFFVSFNEASKAPTMLHMARSSGIIDFCL